MPQKHYTPPLSRFNVCALYHEAKARGIPMTRLANHLLEAASKESPGWKVAQAREAMRVREEPTVPNPAWAAADAQVRQAWADLERLQAQYGLEALTNVEHLHRTMRGFKVAQGKLGQ
jgi:hypothetical protein